MKRCAILIGLLYSVIAHESHAQFPEYTVAGLLRGSYTTTSKLFFNPHAASSELRAQHDEFQDVFGGGLEIRWKPGRNVFLSFTVDYLKKTSESLQLLALTSPPRLFPLTDGFVLIPLEIGGNLYIPLGSKRYRLSMGGGIGAYYTERILKVLDIVAPAVGVATIFGIHVKTAFEYRFLPKWFLILEMRFRDPEVFATNRFSVETLTINDLRLTFPKNDIQSKISVDGINLNLGIAYEFF